MFTPEVIESLADLSLQNCLDHYDRFNGLQDDFRNHMFDPYSYYNGRGLLNYPSNWINHCPNGRGLEHYHLSRNTNFGTFRFCFVGVAQYDIHGNNDLLHDMVEQSCGMLRQRYAMQGLIGLNPGQNTRIVTPYLNRTNRLIEQTRNLDI